MGYVYTAAGAAAPADRLIAAIAERFFLLSRRPRLGRPRDDLRPGLRSFVVQGYVILYRIEGDDVLVLRVFHGRRDIEGFFRR